MRNILKNTTAFAPEGIRGSDTPEIEGQEPAKPATEEESEENLPEETARQKFVRIATNRLLMTTEGLRLLGQIGTSKGYEFDDKDVEKIFGVIEPALAEAKRELTERKKAAKVFPNLFD